MALRVSVELTHTGPSFEAVTCGKALTVTLTDATVEQPFAEVTVTLYVPPVFTVVDCVVAPLDQK